MLHLDGWNKKGQIFKRKQFLTRNVEINFLATLLHKVTKWLITYVIELVSLFLINWESFGA